MTWQNILLLKKVHGPRSQEVVVGTEGLGEGGGGRGRLCLTVTTRITPALRWAAARDVLMFH